MKVESVCNLCECLQPTVLAIIVPFGWPGDLLQAWLIVWPRFLLHLALLIISLHSKIWAINPVSIMLLAPTRIVAKTTTIRPLGWDVTRFFLKIMFDHQQTNLMQKQRLIHTSALVFIRSGIPPAPVNSPVSLRECPSLSILVCLDWLMWCWSKHEWIALVAFVPPSTPLCYSCYHYIFTWRTSVCSLQIGLYQYMSMLWHLEGNCH